MLLTLRFWPCALGEPEVIIWMRWGPVNPEDGVLGKAYCVLSLHKLTLHHHFSFFPADENIPAKILSYNRANRAVAILCNHQRAPPKTFEKSMMNLQSKVFWIWMVGGNKIERTMSAMAIYTPPSGLRWQVASLGSILEERFILTIHGNMIVVTPGRDTEYRVFIVQWVFQVEKLNLM